VRTEKVSPTSIAFSKRIFNKRLTTRLAQNCAQFFLPLRVRAGYNFQMPPLKFRDVERTQRTGFDDARKTVTLGAGLLLRQTLSIDVAYIRTMQSIFGSLYTGSAQVGENAHPQQHRADNEFSLLIQATIIPYLPISTC
jgi:hypothetical protein